MTRDDEQDLLTTPTPRVSLDDHDTGPAAPKRFPDRSHATQQGSKVAPEEAYCPACGASYPPDRSVCPREGARLIKLKAQGDPMLGRVLDARYEVRAALGEGGMGTVYRGLQLSVDREVAIKVIHASLASDRTSVKRFLREARLSSRLAQPSIVNVYDFGQTDDGILYLVMELLRGRTLASELESGQPMTVKRAAHMALQLCDALESAHLEGIIHRDLKPGNITVLDDLPGRDLIKVLDFGLAKSLAAACARPRTPRETSRRLRPLAASASASCCGFATATVVDTATMPRTTQGEDMADILPDRPTIASIDEHVVATYRVVTYRIRSRSRRLLAGRGD